MRNRQALIDRLQRIESMTDGRARGEVQDLLGDIDSLAGGDHYAERVEAFHGEVRRNGDEDYLTVLADRFDEDDLPLPVDSQRASEEAMAEILAERNRLFWSSFLAEETGEVASCLTSGEPPENFEDEVADVVVLCFAIADCFDFDMADAFGRVMDENEHKPKTQEGTGKLPAEARDEWRGDNE